MDKQAIEAVYGRWANLYDLVYGAALEQGRQAAIASLNGGAGRRVLEVGVGTGLSLPLYDRSARVSGVDLCAEMLKQARQRANRLHLPQVETLAVMDGERMAFAAGTFDVVVAMYVLSVTPDPQALMAEMQRVCRPGGEILVVNRFSAENLAGRVAETVLRPFAPMIGFRLGLPFSVLNSLNGSEVLEMRRLRGLAGVHLIRRRNGEE